MKLFLKISVVVFVLFALSHSVDAVEQNSGQTIGVTIDNSLVVTPDTPLIIRLEGITTNTSDLVIEVDSDFSSEMLNFVVSVTNNFTNDTTEINYTQNSDANSRTTLTVMDLDPGTEYTFTVRYARSGGVWSNDSDAHDALTLIDPPILDSINSVAYDSVNLHIEADSDLVGFTMDFIIEFSGGGDSYIIQMTEDVANSNFVDLLIDGLDSDTEYTFSVKYARENTLNFSELSNSLSATTDTNNSDLEAPVIDDIQNITTTSLKLVVEVEEHSGEKCDFIVHVKNVNTGEIFTVNVNKTVGSNDNVILNISELEPGTKYEFKVKYSLDGSSDESDYSDLKSAITENEEDASRQILICFENNIISISESVLSSYLDQGAVVGECASSDNVEICYINETLVVSQNGLQKYLNQGATVGACADIDDTVAGGSVDVSGNLEKEDESESVKDDVREVIAPKETETVYQSIASVGAVTGTVGTLASSAVPLFAAMPGAFSNTIFLRLLEIFGIISRRKKEYNWGVVFDADTRMPIQAAKITLSDIFDKELATTYSDRNGRFGFLVAPGKYKMNVFKKNYKLAMNVLGNDLYENIYNGEEVEVGDDHVILTNIAMKIQGMNWDEYSRKKIRQYNSSLSKFKKFFFSSLYFIGFVATIVITYFYPSMFNFIILGFYVILFVYQKYFKKKKYGIVTTEEGSPIPFAVVSLHDKESAEKRAFAVTDPIGRYYLLTDNGEYNIEVKGQPVGSKNFEKHGDIKVKDGIVCEDIVV